MLCCHQMYYCFLSTFELFLGREVETVTHTESCVGSAGVLEEITCFILSPTQESSMKYDGRQNKLNCL